MHAVGGAECVEAVDGRPDGHGAGADDQLVVVDAPFAAVGGRGRRGCWPATSMRGGAGVQPQLHPGRFEVGVGAVGEVAPVGDLAGHVVGDAADGEVRVGVGDHHGHLGGRVDRPPTRTV